MISKMTENNMQQKTNNVLKFSDNEIKRVGFHKSKENIALFDTDIKKVLCILKYLIHLHTAKTKNQMQNTIQDMKIIIKLKHYLLRFHK